MSLEKSVGDTTLTKQFASLMASGTAEAQNLVNPLYDSEQREDSSGVSGQSSPDPGQTPIPALGTGLGCLPDGVDGTRLTLRNKIVVLNCLVFSTPHSFWVDHADDLRDSPRYNTWLSYGPDWSCTSWPDVSDAVCRKHDVAFASLQNFSGSTTTTDAANEMDEVWNPRNKHLADIVAKAELERYGCQMPSAVAQSVFGACLGTSPWLTGTVLHTGVSRINTKNWPYTDHEIGHSRSFPRYVRCEFPKATNISLVRESSRSFSASWTYDPGCVSDITVDYYRVCWEVEVLNLAGLTGTRVNTYRGDVDGDDPATHTFEVPDQIRLWRSVTASIRVRPNDIVYGGLLGFAGLPDPAFFDEVSLFGVFYDRQYPTMTIIN